MTGLAEKMNEPACNLYRTALRDTCYRLLNSLELPGKKAQAGRLWLTTPRSTADLERFKERILEVLQECRAAA